MLHIEAWIVTQSGELDFFEPELADVKKELGEL